MDKGAIFMLSGGDYSDYRVEGPFRCLQSFDITQTAKIFREEESKTRKRMAYYGYDENRKFIKFDEPQEIEEKVRPSLEKFISYLIREGLAEPVEDIKEFHGSADLGLSY